jgi:hypothetical protein
MRLVALFTTLLGLGVTLVAPAQADEAADDQFLQSLDQARIQYTTPEQAIDYGHRVCLALDQGQRGGRLLTVMTTQNPTLLKWQAGAFFAASVTSYCPNYSEVGLG